MRREKCRKFPCYPSANKIKGGEFMIITYVGRHLSVPEDFKPIAEAKLAKFDKYFKTSQAPRSSSPHPRTVSAWRLPLRQAV